MEYWRDLFEKKLKESYGKLVIVGKVPGFEDALIKLEEIVREYKENGIPSNDNRIQEVLSKIGFEIYYDGKEYKFSSPQIPLNNNGSFTIEMILSREVNISLDSILNDYRTPPKFLEAVNKGIKEALFFRVEWGFYCIFLPKDNKIIRLYRHYGGEKAINMYFDGKKFYEIFTGKKPYVLVKIGKIYIDMPGTNLANFLLDKKIEIKVLPNRIRSK